MRINLNNVKDILLLKPILSDIKEDYPVAFIFLLILCILIYPVWILFAIIFMFERNGGE